MEPNKLVLKTDLDLLSKQEAEASEEDEKFVCPECGSEAVIVVTHCKTCVSCGWSLCSM